MLSRGADIIEHHGVRPLLGEQFPAVRIFLDVGDNFEPGLRGAEVEAADTGEEGDDAELGHTRTLGGIGNSAPTHRHRCSTPGCSFT